MVECEFCGREFDHKNGLNSHIGHAHADKKKRQVECDNCGDELTRHKWRVDEFEKQFCDGDCYTQYKSTQTGKDAPQWDGGKERLRCENCGEYFEVNNYRADNARFCTSECYGEFMTGENHNNWKGGECQYGGQWEKQRQKALKRDNHECVVCGMTKEESKEEYSKALHVHHIRPLREFNEDGEVNYHEAHQEDNLLTLCANCHKEWEGIPVVPENVR